MHEGPSWVQIVVMIVLCAGSLIGVGWQLHDLIVESKKVLTEEEPEGAFEVIQEGNVYHLIRKEEG